MKIKAYFDQTITKAKRDSEGELIGFEPATHHYTFGKVGEQVSGGLYFLAGYPIPETVELEISGKGAENVYNER